MLNGLEWLKHIQKISGQQINAQLYSSCDANVQNSIVSTVSVFFLLFEDDLLNAIEGIVTKQSNLSAHCLTLSSTLQSPHETIVVKLKSLAPDCAFACPACNCDLQFINIWDQFIQGLCNKTLQTDILAKGNHLKELQPLIKHAEAFDSAQRDQTRLQSNAEVMAAWFSYHQFQKKTHCNDKSLLSMYLLQMWNISLTPIVTPLPPPTTLRKSLFPFNLYHKVKIYHLSTSKSFQAVEPGSV